LFFYALTAFHGRAQQPRYVARRHLCGFLQPTCPQLHDSSGPNCPITYNFPNILTDAKLVSPFNTDPAKPLTATAPLVVTVPSSRNHHCLSRGCFSNSFATSLHRQVASPGVTTHYGYSSTRWPPPACAEGSSPQYNHVGRPVRGRNGHRCRYRVPQYETQFTYCRGVRRGTCDRRPVVSRTGWSSPTTVPDHQPRRAAQPDRGQCPRA